MPNDEHKQHLIKFGQHLEKLLKSKNLPLRKLAAKCNLDHSDIKKYENGEIDLSFYSLLELAEGLEITLKELMGF